MLMRRLTFKEKMKHDFKYNRALFAMLIMPMAFLFIFRYLPLWGIQIAFRDYHPLTGISTSPWVGLKYFEKFFRYHKWNELVTNTLLISLWEILFAPSPVLFALLLEHFPSKRYKSFVQTVSFAPHFISTVVLCGMLLQFLSADNGIITVLLSKIGAPRINYMAYPKYFRAIYVLSGVWQHFGFNAIIYIAVLTGVPVTLHEAAIMDGASLLKRILYIDLPEILPRFFSLLILQCGSILNTSTEKMLLLQNNININISEVISTYTYKVGLASTSPNYSYSAAIDIMTAIVNIVILFLIKNIQRKTEAKWDE